MNIAKKSQHGFLMIAAIVLIVSFAVIGVIATYLVNNDALSSTNHLGSDQAFYIAEAGLESATHQVLMSTVANRTACANITGNANLTNATFTGAKGFFTVTGSAQSPTASTLSSAITATTTTIPLVSTATYGITGRIMIDNELIDYSTSNGNSFINVRRGVGGTIATAHASGAPVGQYQCLLQSQGGVPNLSPAGNTIGGSRIVQEAVQLSSGWAVGNTSGSASTIVQWNNPTELQWNNKNIAGLNGALNDVFTLSYADVWAVGNSVGSNFTIVHWNGNTWSTVAAPGTKQNLLGISCTASNNCETVGANKTILIWNGTSWAAQATTALPSVQLNSVYCNTASDCWVVGNSSGTNDVFAHWNGTTWSYNPLVQSPSSNLNSISCNNTNDCWAVGGSRAFLHWNGTAWSAQSVTNLPNVAYTGIACIASNDCWAVGSNSGGALTVNWNGTAWSRVTAPTTTNLLAIACNSANDCWAVGTGGTILHWDGSSWAQVADPLGVQLNAVTALGYTGNPISAWQELFP